MAERNQSVLDRVAQVLREQPGSRSSDLYTLAKGVDPKVGDLSVRQFHASYVLPMRRAGNKAAEKRPARAKGAAKGRQTKPRRSAAAKEPSRP